MYLNLDVHIYMYLNLDVHIYMYLNLDVLDVYIHVSKS